MMVCSFDFLLVDDGLDKFPKFGLVAGYTDANEAG